MHPTLKASIRDRLLAEIPALPKALARAAKYILDHPGEFGVHAIRETSTRVGVSTNTLVRLANHLGFATYEEMRAPFRDALLISDGATADPMIPAGKDLYGPLKAAADYSQNALGNVTKSLRDMDAAQLQSVAQQIVAADRVFSLGHRASFALAYYFHYVGRMAIPNMQLLPKGQYPATDDLLFVGPTDLLLAISIFPYANDTIEACKTAKERGAKVIMLSDSLISAPGLEVDEVLVASTISTTHFTSYTGLWAVLEALLAMISAEGGDASAERAHAFHTLRNDGEAYWKPSKKHKRSY
jgi:DNA-binding MurR/RpiR family transcriptional regulator